MGLGGKKGTPPRRAWETPEIMQTLLSPPIATFALFALLGAALAIASCGGNPPEQPRVWSPAELDLVWKGAGPTIEVKVHELHCSGCEASARKAVGDVAGVASVEANHETDIVLVHLEDGVDRYGTIPAIRDALHAVGKDIVGEDEIP